MQRIGTIGSDPRLGWEIRSTLADGAPPASAGI
jgi:hypothetical protein